MSSSKSPIFRMFNPSGKSKEESVEKRREQVRRAQHVYRQRKTRYVKALEGDLAASRRRETDMSLDKSNLETQVQVLLRLLEQHSIQVPDVVKVPRDENAGLQHLNNNHSIATQYAHSEWPSVSSSISPIPSLSTASDNDPILGTQICNLDLTMVGMRFVLMIEEPCLHHIHGDPTRPDDPSNHALTVTSQLLCISASPPPKRASLLPVQDVPGDILGRLLELAPVVSSGDSELTPIQAWDSLRRKPMIGSLDLRSIMTLAERLRDGIKCHGFGAVMELGVFEHLVGDLVKTSISNGLSTCS